jgi:DNA-binding winged helix-turn-helix (wHTH) protein
VRGKFIAVVGHGPLLERDEGAAWYLRQLGADVRAIDLWDDPATLFRDDEADQEGLARAVIVEALDRPDLAAAALRALRKEARFERVGSILAIGEPHVARVDPAAGFDDFVLVPYVPSELYARIKQIEWRRSEFSNEERLKVGDIVIDRSAREVRVDGAVVPLTAKEFSLLVFLCENRGKVKSREQLLARVWGSSYEGGARTVDIHVRRLRAKLGSSFQLQTMRGAGYKLIFEETSLKREAR